MLRTCIKTYIKSLYVRSFSVKLFTMQSMIKLYQTLSKHDQTVISYLSNTKLNSKTISLWKRKNLTQKETHKLRMWMGSKQNPLGYNYIIMIKILVYFGVYYGVQ